jgi:hypothetical protein
MDYIKFHRNTNLCDYSQQAKIDHGKVVNKHAFGSRMRWDEMSHPNFFEWDHLTISPHV